MAVEARRLTPTPGLFQQAAQVRQEMTHALHEQLWFSRKIPTNVAAAMLGVSNAEMAANPHTSFLFTVRPDGVIVSAGKTRQAAMQAFHEWSTADDEPSRNTFNRDAYMAFYTVLQGAAESAGDVAYQEVAEFFGRTLADADPGWESFLARVRVHGDIPDEQDARMMHRKLQQLWHKIPPGMRASMASYSPNHLFGG
jgi:hypothetical protein